MAKLSQTDGSYREFAFDFTMLFGYFAPPLISALGVYILLRRPDRVSAKSQLHVWSYRSVLWLFLTSIFVDDSITAALNSHSLTSLGATARAFTWDQLVFFTIGSCVSLLLQVLIANLKLMCLLWNRLAAFATLLAAALAITMGGFCVSIFHAEICYSDSLNHFAFDHEALAAVKAQTCSSSALRNSFERWAWAGISIVFVLGPLQSVGMWCVAFKAVHDLDWEELRWEIRFLCVSSFCTMIGTPLTAGILTSFLRVSPTKITKRVLFLLHLSFQMLNSLVLGGMIGPKKWRKPLDMFKELGLKGGLNAKRIAFPGKINLLADDCIVSFPGIYSQEWDTAVAVASEQQACSLACVFLTDTASGLGQHVSNPDSPGNCYCKALYGSVPVETYLCEVDLSNEVAIDQQQLAFKKADAKAMGQLLLIRHSHTTLLEWKEEKAAARRTAYKLWQENEGRAPWGCAWFHLWKENVDQAVERNQSLHVFYFKGRVGAGKVSWDELADEDTRKKAREGGGLGNSQTAEVAYLDKQALTYLEHDVADFKAFIQSSSVVPEQVGPEKGQFECEVTVKFWVLYLFEAHKRLYFKTNGGNTPSSLHHPCCVQDQKISRKMFCYKRSWGKKFLSFSIFPFG